MELRIAETAGFCMGVSLALGKLDKAVASSPQSRILTLGPIIHNPQVLEQYENKGVCLSRAPEDVNPGDIVVIRAHGIPRQLEAEYAERGAVFVDATCPKVKRAQVLIQREADKGGHLVLFGEGKHPEVRGLLSYATKSTVIESLKDAQAFEPSSGKTYFLAAQTTQDRNLFQEIGLIFQEKTDGPCVILDTVCMATKDRQEEVRQLAKEVEAMVIVGGRSSGNTRRLAQIAAECCAFAVHVETADEIPLVELRRYSVIGLSAGASTPAYLIEEAARCLMTC